MRNSVVPIPMDTMNDYPKYFSAVCPICTHTLTFSVWNADDERRAKQREGSFLQKYCGYCRDTVNVSKIEKMGEREYYDRKPNW